MIGLLEFERINKQEISVDIELRASEFIDYAFVCERIKSEFTVREFKKVEDALIFFKSEFKRVFPNLRYISMKISKLEIVENAVVGAKIEHFY